MSIHLDRVRGRRGTVVVIAVGQVQGAPQLDQQAIGEQVEVGRLSIKLPRQAVIGDNRPGTSQLGFAKDKRQNRVVEIVFSGPRLSPGVSINVVLHGDWNFGRVKLLALGAHREGG